MIKTASNPFSRYAAAFTAKFWEFFGAEGVSEIADGQKEITVGAICIEVGMAVGGKYIKPVKTVIKKGDNFVDGYRAVSKAEANDIAKHGFRPNPNGQSMQDKWFSETKSSAEKFQQYYPDLDGGIIKTKVPKDVYDRSYKHPNIDNTGPGFCVSCNDLKHLK